MKLAPNQITSILSQYDAIVPTIGKPRALTEVIKALQAFGADSNAINELEKASDLKSELTRLFSQTVTKEPTSRIEEYCNRHNALQKKMCVVLGPVDRTKLASHQIEALDALEKFKENTQLVAPIIARNERGEIKPIFRYSACVGADSNKKTFGVEWSL